MNLDAEQLTEMTQKSDALLRDADIVAYAQELHNEDGRYEIDEGAVVSHGEDNGAYVAGWFWVPFAGTPWDKAAEEEEDQSEDVAPESPAVDPGS